MKVAILIAAAAFCLSTGTAFAEAEGNGNPFPFRAPGIVTFTKGLAHLAAKGQDPFPFRGNDAVNPAYSEQVLPEMSSESPVQTANSLPVGFEAGTPAVQHAQFAQAYQHRQAEVRALALMTRKAAAATQHG